MKMWTNLTTMNDGVEVQFNNCKDTNTTAEASEETC